MVGRTRGGKATKSMAVADRHDLPIAAGIASGERHETQLTLETLDACFATQVPFVLIGDKAYDSDKLDRGLARLGIKMVAPHRRNGQRKTQDGRVL